MIRTRPGGWVENIVGHMAILDSVPLTIHGNQFVPLTMFVAKDEGVAINLHGFLIWALSAHIIDECGGAWLITCT
jgi:hypothetical protein